jgi:hypothetical protein
MSAGVMYYDDRRAAGLPGAAIRLGRMLELWGRRAARPLDRDEVLRRRAHARRVAEHRTMADEALLLRRTF